MKATVLILFVSLSSYGVGNAVGPISLSKQDPAAGCLFVEQNPEGRTLLLADHGSSGRALINGEKIDLELQSSNAMSANKPGDAVSQKLVHGGVQFSFSGTMISKCASEGPLCDFSKGTLVVDVEKLRESYKVIERCGKLPLPK